MNVYMNYNQDTGQFAADDPISIERMDKLKTGRYKCNIVKPRLERPIDEIRSDAQNRLLHDIHACQEKTDVEEHAGILAEDWKNRMKYLFLWDMYLDFNIKGMADVIKPMMADYTPMQYDLAKWRLIREGWITTHDLSVQMLRLYLSRLLHWCRMEGIYLTLDSHLYEMAMEER